MLRSEGRSLSRSPIAVLLVWKSSSPVTVVIGTVDSRFGRAMREPVITTSVGAASWAVAAFAAASSAAATAIRTGVLPFMAVISDTPLISKKIWRERTRVTRTLDAPRPVWSRRKGGALI